MKEKFLRWKLALSAFLSLCLLFSTAQTMKKGVLKGYVTNQENHSLADVHIQLINSDRKAVGEAFSTDSGTFEIQNLPVDSAYKLIATVNGYSTYSLDNVYIKRSSNVVIIQMSISRKTTLDEVVVVGYGTQKKSNLTGAVANITAEKIGRVKVNTVAEALVGQIPNFNIGIADGKPGREASFNIRGTTSINGGDPLILIDGIVSTSRTLNNMSPQDIESISFLKDASSAAIYGARAAYGVVLIQTKKGKNGEPKINYNNYFSWSKATRTPDVYGGADYFDIVQNEFNKNIGQSYYTADQVNYPYEVQKDPTLPKSQLTTIGGKSVLLLAQPHNYYKEWLKTYSPSQNHHLSLSTGGEKFNTYLSFDYNHQGGNLKFKSDDINRYGVRFNAEYNISKAVKVFTKNSLVIRDDHNPYTYVSPFASTLYRFIETTNPFLPETVNVNGTDVMTDMGWYKNYIQNQSDFQQKHVTTVNIIGTDIRVLGDRLVFHGDASYTNYNLSQLSWWYRDGPYIHNSYNNLNTILDTWSDWGMSPEQVQKYNSRSNTYYTNAYFQYKENIKGHSISITGGSSFEKYIYHSETAAHQNPIRGLDELSLNLATGDYSASDNDDKYANRSVFLRANYNYKSKYLLEFNGMNNISSKFSKGQRSGNFGSISGGWRMSDEKFFSRIKNVINNLKLRASYGALGNQSIGSYDHLSLLNLNYSTYSLDGTRYNYLSTPSPISDNFTWEVAKTADIGIDFSAVKNRLQVTMDVYQRNTERMLVPSQSLPSVFGASVPRTNAGNLRNRGWEFSATWSDHVGEVHPFSYSLTLNVSDYNAVITKYRNTTNYLGSYYVGQHIGEIWGLTTLGLYQTDAEAKSGPLMDNNDNSWAAAGYLKFEDKDRDGKISKKSWTVNDHGDYSVIGNTTPRYQYGIVVSLNYRGFDLNAVFNGVGKREVYPNGDAISFWGPYSRKYAYLTDNIVKNRWTTDNPNAYFPRPQGYIALGSGYLGTPQTRYLQNAAFFRLKNLNLGYNFKTKIGTHYNQWRVYVSGANVFEITKLSKAFDPEGLSLDPDGNSGYLGTGTAYPIQRTYAVGVELTL